LSTAHRRTRDAAVALLVGDAGAVTVGDVVTGVLAPVALGDCVATGDSDAAAVVAVAVGGVVTVTVDVQALSSGRQTKIPTDSTDNR